MMHRNFKHSIEKCIVCSNSFKRAVKKMNGRTLPSDVRSMQCRTCSPKCSRQRRWYKAKETTNKWRVKRRKESFENYLKRLKQ